MTRIFAFDCLLRRTVYPTSVLHQIRVNFPVLSSSTVLYEVLLAEHPKEAEYTFEKRSSLYQT